MQKRKTSPSGRYDGSNAVSMYRLANENKICQIFTDRNKSSDIFFCDIYEEKLFYGERMPPTGHDEEKHYQLCAALPRHL